MLTNITTRTLNKSPFITQLYHHGDMQIYSDKKTEWDKKLSAW